MLKNTELYVTLAQIIANKRDELGITQAKLAEKLNVDRRTIMRWESGNISLHDYCRVCEKLNMSILVIPKQQLEQFIPRPEKPQEQTKNQLK